MKKNFMGQIKKMLKRKLKLILLIVLTLVICISVNGISAADIEDLNINSSNNINTNIKINEIYSSQNEDIDFNLTDNSNYQKENNILSAVNSPTVSAVDGSEYEKQDYIINKDSTLQEVVRINNNNIVCNNSILSRVNKYDSIYISPNGNGKGTSINDTTNWANALSIIPEKGIIYFTQGTYYLSNQVISHNLTLSSINGEVVLDAENKGNVFIVFDEDKLLTIKGLSFINGKSFYENKGGSIYSESPLIIINSQFSNNTAANYGGAVFSNKNIVIYNSTFINNYANKEGAVVYASGDVKISNSILINMHSNSVIYSQRGTIEASYNWWGDNNPFVGDKYGNLICQEGTNITIPNVSVVDGVVGSFNLTLPDTGSYNTTVYYLGDTGIELSNKTGHVISYPYPTSVSNETLVGVPGASTGNIIINVTALTNGVIDFPDGSIVTINGTNYPIINDTVTFVGTYPSDPNSIISYNVTYPGSINLLPSSGYINLTSKEVPKILNVTINKTANVTSVIAGKDYIQYNITVNSNSNYNLTNVNVSDVINSDYLTVIGYSVDNGATWNNDWKDYYMISNLTIGNTFTILINCSVKSNAEGKIFNNANVTFPNDPNNNIGNNNSNVTVVVTKLYPNLEISKIVNTTLVYYGDSVLYTITVTNNGQASATNVLISDAIPSVLSNPEYYDGQKWVSFTGNIRISQLNVGESYILFIRANYTSSDDISQFVNVATVTSPDDPNSHHDEVTVYVTESDIAVFKSVNNTNPNFGDTVTYTINVTNYGPDTAGDVVVFDLLPSGLVFISANDTNLNESLEAWEVGNLSVNQTLSLTLIALVNGTGNMTNTVVGFTSSYDKNLTNNDANVTITVPYTSDLSVSKTTNITNYTVGNKVTYTIIVTNNGPDNATGVFVSENLPDGLIYVSDSANGAYNSTSGIWNIGNLGNGDSVALTITAIVNKKGNITNLVNVSGNEVDNNKTNNYDNVTVVGNLIVDLSINETVSNSNPKVGSTVVWTVTVTNNGPCNDTNVVVKDVSPDMVKYLKSVASQGYYNDSTDTWYIGNLSAGQTVTLTITTKVLTTGKFTLSTTVSGDGAEVTLANNNATASIFVNQSGNTPGHPVGPNHQGLTPGVNHNGVTSNGLSDLASNNGSSNGVSMAKTGNPILVLLLILSVLVGIRPFRKNRK
jgi:uncharacterized repeat protein (TIGR01451 family)